MTPPAWDRTVFPSLTVIRSSKFHHHCAQALMASQAASNFNFPFLSPKSHSPSRAGALHQQMWQRWQGRASQGRKPWAQPSPPALMPSVQRNQQLPKSRREAGTSITFPGRAGACPCPPPAQPHRAPCVQTCPGPTHGERRCWNSPAATSNKPLWWKLPMAGPCPKSRLEP